MVSETQHDTLLNVKEAAAYLTVHPMTLNRWRHIGTGPAYSKIGNRVVYRKSMLDSYVRRRQVSPGADMTE